MSKKDIKKTGIRVFYIGKKQVALTPNYTVYERVRGRWQLVSLNDNSSAAAWSMLDIVSHTILLDADLNQ